LSSRKRNADKTFAGLLLAAILVASVAVYYLIDAETSRINPFPSPSPSTSPNATASPAPSSSTAPVEVTDLNWGGYIAASDHQNPKPEVTAVSASWVVPAVSASANDAFSSVWVGIGGFFDNSLIQAGTEQDSISGQPTYSAWYEVLPQFSNPICCTLIISPGDNVQTQISLSDPSTNLWLIEIVDVTTGEQFNTTIAYGSGMLSADWEIERPTINKSTTSLADFGSTTMSNCQATIGGTTGAISDFPSARLTMYGRVMNGREANQLVSVSNLEVDGKTFAISFVG
jgi:hypothetical protein